MAMNFMKNIIEGNPDEEAHSKFTRFGKGNFEREELKIKITGKNIQIQAGPEYVSVLFKILAKVVDSDVSVKGKMVAKKGQDKRFSDAGIELKATRANTYTIEHTFSAQDFRSFVDDFSDFLFLITVNAGKNSIKVKPSVPKPGKPIEKFITAKFDKTNIDLIMEEFCFDCDEKNAKEYIFKHHYEIKDIIVDESLLDKDPLKARLQAKRKGTIKRIIKVLGNEKTKEIPFEV